MEPTTNVQPRVALSRSILGTFGVLACHAAAVGVLIVIFAVVVPHYMAIFEDRDAELPSITIMFVKLSNWLTDYWYVLVFLLLPDGLVYFGLSRLTYKWNWLATSWAMLWLMATIGVLFVEAIAMYHPVEELLTARKGP